MVLLMNLAERLPVSIRKRWLPTIVLGVMTVALSLLIWFDPPKDSYVDRSVIPALWWWFGTFALTSAVVSYALPKQVKPLARTIIATAVGIAAVFAVTPILDHFY
jgi:hypothetical protein